jgi:hypothetical protein
MRMPWGCGFLGGKEAKKQCYRNFALVVIYDPVYKSSASADHH